MPRQLTLREVEGNFAVCKLASNEVIPTWATLSEFFSITSTRDELSIICSESDVPADVRCERDWRCLRVDGAMAFTEIGVLASLVTPLATRSVSVFAISTFDTDYLLVKGADWTKTKETLRDANHRILQRK